MEDDVAGDESFVIRFHMVVNRDAHPDIAWLLKSLPKRARNRKIKGLLMRAAHAERYGSVTAPPAHRESQPSLPSPGAPPSIGLLPGMEAEDVFEVFGQFGDTEPMPARS